MNYTRRVLLVLACVAAVSLSGLAQTSSTTTTTTTTTKKTTTTTKKKATKKKAATKPVAKAAPATETTKPAAGEPAKPAAPAKPATSGEQAKPATPATPAAPAKPAATEKKTAPPDVIVLKGAPMGGVRFQHKAHNTDRKIKCETCHHPSKAEKPAKAAQQACRDCHTPVATPPMKTKTQAAFHNPTATAGTCIDCHKAENAKGKNAPTKCMQCHNKANV